MLDNEEWLLPLLIESRTRGGGSGYTDNGGPGIDPVPLMDELSKLKLALLLEGSVLATLEMVAKSTSSPTLEVESPIISGSNTRFATEEAECVLPCG